jgi:FkbM family methyltransferase
VPLDLIALYDAALGFEDAPEECERIVRRVYEAVLVPGDAAVDVGAHVGKHTLPMALVCGGAGSVVALEPIPWAHQRLLERVASSGLGGTTKVLHACCGDVAGEATFSVVVSHPGWSSLAPRADADDVQQIRVRQTTLDDECLGGPPVRFVKIDVEGAEELVPRGARELLRRDRPVVHVEVVLSALQAFGAAVGGVRDHLESHGYRVFDLLGNDVTETATWERSVTAPGLSDYIAVHPEDPAFSAVRDVLASSFAEERWNRVDAPAGLMPPPLRPNEHPTPGVPPMDGARPLPERLVRPVGPVPATVWPQPADARAELLLSDPIAWLNPRRGSVQTGVHALRTALPVSIGPSVLTEEQQPASSP